MQYLYILFSYSQSIHELQYCNKPLSKYVDSSIDPFKRIETEEKWIDQRQDRKRMKKDR